MIDQFSLKGDKKAQTTQLPVSFAQEMKFALVFNLKWKKKWKHKVGERSMNQLYAEHWNLFFSLFSRGNRFWFELPRDSSKWGFKLSGVNCNNTREFFFMSVWLHNNFILCQNKIFCINDAKMRPRLNTAHVKVKQSLTCNIFLYVPFLFNELLFFLYLQNIHTVFLLLDDDIREHRNVVL